MHFLKLRQDLQDQLDLILLFLLRARSCVRLFAVNNIALCTSTTHLDIIASILYSVKSYMDPTYPVYPVFV
jgi:hypothetical protein